MENDVTTSETIGKYLIEIISDTTPESPRDWDNIGTMVCFHRTYQLGDKHNHHFNDFNGWNDFEQHITKSENVGVILPLYLYDHSGLTMNTTGFQCPWDSGQVGFIFVSKKKIREEFGVKYVTGKVVDKVEKMLVGEVEVFDQYLRGDVYGYRITDTELDEEIDSCWGFYGEDYCLEEAKRVVEYHTQQETV